MGRGVGDPPNAKTIYKKKNNKISLVRKLLRRISPKLKEVIERTKSGRVPTRLFCNKKSASHERKKRFIIPIYFK